MNSKNSSNNNELDDVNYNPDSDSSNNYPTNLLENSNTSAQFQAQGLPLSTPPILSWSSARGNIPSAVYNNGGSNSNISETFLNVSEPVDDYSLDYVLSLGIRYCANFKQSREGSSSNSGGGGLEGTLPDPTPGNQLVNPLRPVLKSSNEIDYEHNGSRTGNSPFGGHHRAPLQHYQASSYPGITRYAENFQALVHGKAGSQQENGNAGAFNVKGQSVWGYDMETTKFQSNSSMANLLPNYSDQNEVKQVPLGEYWNALGWISPRHSYDKKWQEILWSAPARDFEGTKALGFPGAGNYGPQTNNSINMASNYGSTGGLQHTGQNQNFQMNQNYPNFTFEALEKSCSQNSNFQAGPAASFTGGGGGGSGSGGGIGMEKYCNGVGSTDANLITTFDINGEDFASGIWEECGPLPLFGGDCLTINWNPNQDSTVSSNNISIFDEYYQAKGLTGNEHFVKQSPGTQGAKGGTAGEAMDIQETMLNGAGNGLETIDSGADSNGSVGIKKKSSNSSESLSPTGSQNSSSQTNPRFKYGDESVIEKNNGEGSKMLDDEEEDFVAGMLEEISGEVSATNGGGVIVGDGSTPAKELTGIENCTEQKCPETEGEGSFKAD